MPLQPTILIGVGGSGGKSLRTLRQTLLRRLRAAGWESNELPQAWQMLAVDTVTDNAADSYPDELLPGRDYMGLVPDAVTYNVIRDSLLKSINDRDLRDKAYAGWLPSHTAVPIHKGAGQYRSIGRAVSAWSLERLRHRVQDAYTAARTPAALTELAQVQRLLDIQDEGASGDSSPRVFPVVIASLAGGTGSGMFMDVVETLAAVDPQLDEDSQVILFGPDIFGPLLAGPAGVGIPANTLAAVGSVTAGVWGHAASDGTEALYASHGIAGARAGGGNLERGAGSRNNYVIGAVNANGTFVGNMGDAYRALGESLALIMSDPVVMFEWNQVLGCNIFPGSWNSNTCGDNSGLHIADPRYTQPFGSFGSAKVSIGTGRFHEYAAEALAREAIERLLWPALEPLDPDDDRTDEAKIRDSAEQLWESILRRSGLDERDDRDDVVNALASPELEAMAQGAGAAILNKAAAGNKPQDPATWARNIQTVLDGGLSDFLEQAASQRRELARRWVERMKSALPELAGEIAASRGIAVSRYLIERLREEIRFVASSQLPMEAEQQQRSLSDLPGRLSSILNNSGLSSFALDHPVMTQTRATIAKALLLQEGALRWRTAAALMLDLEENLLAPLSLALSHSRSELQSRVDASHMEDGRPNPFSSYPHFGDLPGKRYRPGPTELLLLSPDKFPETLEKYTRDSLPSDKRDDWTRQLVSCAVHNESLAGQSLGKPFAVVQTGWVTRVPEAQTADSSLPTSAGFVVLAKPEEILDRSYDVLTDKDSAIGKFVGQSLKDWLSTPDPAERNRRSDDFVSSLAAVFSLSAPLVEENPILMGQLHPAKSAGETKKICSPIPVKPTDELYGKIQNALGGAWDSSFSPRWFGDTKSSEVIVFQGSAVSSSATALSSLMRPVMNQWMKIRDDALTRDGFWAGKRARPLIETIPVVPPLLNDMIKGWFISMILGQRITDSPNSKLGSRTQIWDGEDAVWRSFPYPLLITDDEDGKSQLPAVLLSVLIAMAECDHQSSLEPLRPYQRLAELGRGAELSEWIKSGRTAGQAPEPTEKHAGPSEGSSADRAEIVAKRLKASLESYRKYFDKMESEKDVFTLPLAWEIGEQIELAHEQILHLVTAADADDDESFE
jgi:hypothetical protein